MIAHRRAAGSRPPRWPSCTASGAYGWPWWTWEDVYDEFHGGIVHPRALKRFIGHAYHRWQAPAPRFVLLVGDASWDPKAEQVVEGEERQYADWTYMPRHRTAFAMNRSTPYAETASLGHRNLVPTAGYAHAQGEAASDNWFVAVDGDDDLPELAIGRLPVTEPEEVAAIVAKTMRYMSDPGAGGLAPGGAVDQRRRQSSGRHQRYPRRLPGGPGVVVLEGQAGPQHRHQRGASGESTVRLPAGSGAGPFHRPRWPLYLAHGAG